MSMLQMSVSGAMMILMIVVIRAAALYRLPKQTFVVLWDAALLRLLLPFSLPSAYSAAGVLARLFPAAEATGERAARLSSMLGPVMTGPVENTGAAIAEMPAEPWPTIGALADTWQLIALAVWGPASWPLPPFSRSAMENAAGNFAPPCLWTMPLRKTGWRPTLCAALCSSGSRTGSRSR